MKTTTQDNQQVENVISELVLLHCGETAAKRFTKRGKRSKQSVDEVVRRAVSNLLSRASLYRRG